MPGGWLGGLLAELTGFAREEGLGAARFTGLGAFRDVVLGFFELERKDYRRIPIQEQVEVLALIGDVALQGETPALHAHVVVGKADGSAHGGHLLEAHLHRYTDAATGLALIRTDRGRS